MVRQSDGKRAIAEHGLEVAIQRLDGLMPDRSDDTLLDAVVAAGDALHWAVALDEWHRKQLPKEQWKTYRERRDEHVDGALVGAAYYARNRVTHELLAHVRAGGGFTFPIAFPFVIPPPQWVWGPAPAKDRRDEPGRRAYAAYFAGAHAVSTLRRVQAFLIEHAVDVVTGGTPRREATPTMPNYRPPAKA